MKLSDLELYRDEEGCINIDSLIDEQNPYLSEEVRGSSNREKDWLYLDDTSVLLRTENLISEDVLYSSYAELLVEELAKQVGIPSAHYDLIKYKGEKGVLSVNIKNGINNSLITNDVLLDAIGIEQERNAPVVIDNLFKGFSGLSRYDDISKNNIRKLNRNMAKIAIFDTFVMATDRHIENSGILFNGQDNVEIAPIFDNECSLMLDEPESEIESMLVDKRYMLQKVKNNNQMIVIDEDDRDKDENDVPINSDWEDMIYYLCDNSDEFMDFARDCANNLNIKKAISAVEERIKTKLPEQLKLYLPKVFETRKKLIERDLMIEEIAI